MNKKAVADLFTVKKRAPEIKAAFEAVASSIRSEYGDVDEGLLNGELQNNESIVILAKATNGQIHCVSTSWNPTEVRRYNEHSDWNFSYNKKYAWAYWSARHFLALCSRYQLEIKFRY